VLLATPALSFAALDEYLLAVTHDLPAVAKDALQAIDGDRGNCSRARLSPRWPTTAVALELVRGGDPRLRGEQEYADLLAEIARCGRASKRQNPATRCTQTDGTQPGSAAAALELEQSVGVIADRLQQPPSASSPEVPIPPTRMRKPHCASQISCARGGRLRRRRR
jgi:hypothetical protein